MSVAISIFQAAWQREGRTGGRRTHGSSNPVMGLPRPMGVGGGGERRNASNFSFFSLTEMILCTIVCLSEKFVSGRKNEEKTHTKICCLCLWGPEQKKGMGAGSYDSLNAKRVAWSNSILII